MAILALLLLLAGCSALASKEATVGCQAADAITTKVALSHGAREANPLMARVIAHFGFGGLVIVKLLLVSTLLNYHEDIPQTTRATLNGATCAVALHNAALGVQLSK